MPRLIRYILLSIVFLAPHVYAASAAPTEESIKQLLAVTEARKLVDGMMIRMDEMMKSAVQQGLQGQRATPEQQKIIAEMQSKTIALFKDELDWERLEPLYIRIYRDSFTQEEISGILAFYKTPAGQAAIKKMPVVMQTAMGEMQNRMGPIVQKLQKIQEETLRELKAKSDK